MAAWGTGDFDGHEKLVERQMAKFESAPDSVMEMSLQIQRAMALYYQNNIGDAKKILKTVVEQKKQLKNPGILVGRALNLLTAVYKRQGKFGNAMECVERARACLEGQDSAHDKAELHQSKAMEKAQGASALIHQHGFKLEFASAKSRIDHLSSSAQARVQEYLAESESAHSRYDKYWIKRLQLFPFTYKANP